MEQKVTEFIFQKVKENGSFPDDFFPVKTENLVVGIADDSPAFAQYGIKQGTILFFDRTKTFEDGMASLFINVDTGVMKLMKHRKRGFHHAGALIATLSRSCG